MKQRLLQALFIIGAFVFFGPPAEAINGFRSDKIIDDSIARQTTYNSSQVVQSFLNNNGNACVISTCLRNYSENGKSAADILANAATNNNINVFVLLSMMETETELVTNAAPQQTSFNNAMGLPTVVGFSAQVAEAAALLNRTIQNNNGTYPSGVTSTLLWNPNQSCGSASLTPLTNATGAIYSYPNLGYLPNSAALSARRGPGDDCSSYGIRNFYINYNEWFGPSVNGAPRLDVRYVYRFGGMPGDTHFWTADTYEKDSMIRSGYRYEGIGWRIPIGATPMPVYRLYNPTIRRHLYTLDAWEVHMLTSSAGWRSEGVAWNATNDQAGAPVYRLYSPSTYEHFFTTDAWEVHVLTVQNHIFQDEGIAWRQPVMY